MAANSSNTGSGENDIIKTSIDLILKLGALVLVIFFCFKIIQPFISLLIWAIIIAIIIYPLFRRLNRYLGDRKKITAFLLMIVAMAILVFPSIWLVNQLVEGIKILGENMPDGYLQIPPPSESVNDWPIVGGWLYDNWLQASQNLGQSVKGFIPQITKFGEKLLGSLANTGLGVLQFAGSIVLAGIFLVFYEKASSSGNKILRKVAGERGEEFMTIAQTTIRNVATGVIGVALIQTALIGAALVLAGVPLAAVWIIILLIMAISQIPVIVFNIPVIIYLFAFKEPLPAILWSVFLLLAGLIDNVLKPLIMGKGADVPMLVIFFGAIGGFMAFGFMGLFLGAIVLSLGYKLYITWVSGD